MAYRNSVDSTGTLFFTKYSDPNACTSLYNVVDQKERNRFRSTFQASRIGDQRKMDEIQIMFNNYTLFKYGQVASSVGKKRNSTSNIPVPETEVNPNKYKNKKERMKDSEHLK